MCNWPARCGLAQGKQFAEATDVLEPLVPLMPVAAFERMRLNMQLKRTAESRQDARSLVTQMAGLSQRNHEFSPTEYQWWLAAEELLGNWDQMDNILEDWRKLEPENEQVRGALAMVYRRQAGTLLGSPLPNPDAIVDLLLNATELDANAAAMQQLAQGLYNDVDRVPVIRQLLTALSESPRTSPAADAAGDRGRDSRPPRRSPPVSRGFACQGRHQPDHLE